ncbi:DUF6777 domain-containing protein [Streptomyces sp. NPDC058718]|uniref:DUF6777 domain-containing protein n=1 Tax=Streptomyces sp. NPDC058718 TaxID=3346610 RepID=UPI00369D9091
MTSHPPPDPPAGPPSGPPSIPPSGPPSGPLSEPGARPGSAGPPPPPGPPSGGGSGGGYGAGGSSGGGGASGGGPGKGGDRPWWRSVPKVASVTAILVAGAALAVVLTNQSDEKSDTASGGGEVFLQNASASGPDPFTQSTARTGTSSSAPASSPASPPASSPASLPPRTASAQTGTPRVSGSAPGLYGGTQSVASCDVEQQVRYLSAEPAKNAAFASVVGVKPDQVPGYIRSLTPLQLRVDTRVTNHGYRNGSATTYQSVLQSGTAVLVDGRGVPRVRCACGNPLTEPVAQKAPRETGKPWQGYNANRVVVVAPSVTVVNVFVVYDVEDDGWFARKHGDTGKQDKPTPPPPPPSHSSSPPVSPSTSASTSASTSPSSPVPCVTVTGTDTPTPVDGVTPSPCPSTLTPTDTPSSPTDSTSPSDESSPPESSPAEESSPADESTGPESGEATDNGRSAELTTTTPADESASLVSPFSPSSPQSRSQSPSASAPRSPSVSLAESPSVAGTGSVPAPGPGTAPFV